MGSPSAALQQQAARLLSADGRPVQLIAQEATGPDPMRNIRPGQVLTGLVLEAFANDTYLINIRGKHMITASRVPLQRDQTVSFEVRAQGEQLMLRLAQAGKVDHAATSSITKQLQQLQLPDNVLGRLLLASFQDFGAPLQADRLQQAFQQVLAHNATSQSAQEAPRRRLAIINCWWLVTNKPAVSSALMPC